MAVGHQLGLWPLCIWWKELIKSFIPHFYVASFLLVFTCSFSFLFCFSFFRTNRFSFYFVFYNHFLFNVIIVLSSLPV